MKVASAAHGRARRHTLLLASTAIALTSVVAGARGGEVYTGDTSSSSGFDLIGQSGVGDLTIDGGSDASRTTVFLGQYVGSQGTVTVTGEGTSLTTNALHVGVVGTGDVLIEDGADVWAQQVTAGYSSYGTGSVTVTGDGSNLDIAQTAHFGGDGIGILTISDGGTVTVGSGSGTLHLSENVSGTSSTTSNGTLNVGAAAGQAAVAAGYLEAATVDMGTNGGTVVFNHTDTDYEFDAGITGNGNVLFYAGDTILTGVSNVTGDTTIYGGSVSVAGSAASYSTTGLYIDGVTGTAMTVENGADLAADTIWLASSEGNSGALTVTGNGSSATAGTLLVGRGGSGTMTIENGADVVTGLTRIGHDSNSAGTMTVTGDGTTLDSGDLYVGYYAPGNFIASDGADVTSDLVNIGYDATAEGTATLRGEGTTWTGATEAFIGFGGTGTLTVEDGADFSATDIYLGRLTDSEGTVTVTGAGSSLTASNRLFVGYDGDATLTIADGASMTSYDGFIGNGTSTTAEVTVTGTGSSWISSNQLFVGWTSSGSLTVAEGGHINAGGIYIGTNTGSTGTLNIGAAAGETAVAAGSVDTDYIVFYNGTGSIVFNHTDTDYEFDAKIMSSWPGGGAIDVYSGTTSLTGDLSAFTGSTDIYGGTLAVNTSMASPITVHDDGILGGSGTVSDVTLLSGAVIAPGNSIGTLTVDGGLTFVNGTTYAVQVNGAGDSDLLDVNGAVSINQGSTVSVSADNGSDDGSTYAPETTYTILTADNGVSGTFGSVTENFAYLSALLTYDANNVYLKLSRSDNGGGGVVDFADLATSGNRRNTANAIESIGSGALYNAILSLPDGAPDNAFQQLSGEVHATAAAYQQDQARRGSRVVTGQLSRTARNASPYGSAVSAYAEDPVMPFARQDTERHVWTSAYGSHASIDADNDAAGGSASGGGVYFGIDGDLSDHIKLGALFGYGQDSVSEAGVDSTTSMDSYSLGLYGAGDFGPASLRFGAIHAFQRFDSEREVSFAGFSDRLSADYDGSTSQAFIEGAWRIDRDLVHIEPYANLAFIHGRTEGFTEQGGAAALTSEGASSNQFVTTLGLRAERDIAIEGMLGRVSADLGWSHVMGDLTSQTTMSFAGSDSFAVSSATGDRDTAQLSLGIDLDLSENTNLSLSYSGQFSASTIQHTASTRLGIRF